jgi:hypothetical protein
MSAFASSMVVAGILLAAASPQPTATVHGIVKDAQTGLPVPQVNVLLDGRVVAPSDAAGVFMFLTTPRDHVQLIFTAVGYGLVKRSVAILAGRNELGEIQLNRESATVSERVDVTAVSPSLGLAALTLTKSDLHALSMVLLDDPLRSVHALPGVAANNDLRAEFSLRGAGFDQIGVYVDGVRTGGFLHMLADSGTTDQLSLSIVNQDTVAGATLVQGVTAAPVGAATAGVLDLNTREGSRDRVTSHFSTGFVATSGVVEGPLTALDGSWLVAARTTRAAYVQQLVDRVTRSADMEGGSDLQFDDLHAKGVFDVTPRHHLSVSFLAGRFTNIATDEQKAALASDPNAVDRARSGNWLRNAGWRYAPRSSVLTEVRAFSVGSSYRERAGDVVLFANRRTGSGVRADLTFQAGRRHLVQTGVYAQSTSEVTEARFFPASGPAIALGLFSHRRFEPSWYLEDRWSTTSSLTTTAGVRVDRIGSETLVAPRVSAALAVGARTTVRGTAGVHYQPPPLSALYGVIGNALLHAPRSTEIDLGVEQRLSDSVTLTLNAYRRDDRGHLFALAEPRVEGGETTAALHPFENALDVDARGFEVAVRRGSTNRFSGWLGYAFGRAPVTDTVNGMSFPSDFDQRHTANAFGSYRLSATLALSGQVRYGSGMPRPGFFRLVGSTLELGPERNLFRLDPYTRLDLKIRKAYLWGARTFTLSGEVLNVLNAKNEYNVTSTLFAVATTGRYTSGQRRSFGVLPAIGLSIQF